MTKLFFYIPLVFVFMSSCNNTSTKTTRDIHNIDSSNYRNSSCNRMINKKDTINKILSTCTIRVCSYPEMVGPDFYLLYSVIDLLYPNDSNIFKHLKSSKILIEKESVKKKKAKINYTEKSNFSNICEGSIAPTIFEGRLFYVKDKLIDKSTGADFSGYFLIADSIQ